VVLRMEVEGSSARIAPALRALPGVTHVAFRQQAGDGVWEVTLEVVEAVATLPQAVQTISEQGLRVRHLQLLEMSLEDVFIALTGRRLRD